MNYIAAIDQGTTSTRCIIFDKKGSIASIGQKEHAQIFPRPGWVEHDAVEVWANALEVVESALKKKKATAADIAAVGITNQRETTVLWDRRTGRPFSNAIVWQDTRVGERVAQLEKTVGSAWFRDRTGLPLATYFSGLKIQWILENVPEARRAAERGDCLFGNMDTWLIWNLTGGTAGGLHLTDPTNASRTQLMDLKTLAWDAEILEKLGIPTSILPKIEPSSKVYGEIKAGKLAGRPLAGDLGDQQAALVGQACFEPGEAKNTYGTGCFMLMNTGREAVPSQFGLLTTVAYQLEGQPAHFALEGSVAIAGALVQWLRDNLGLIERSSDIEGLARTVDDSGGAYFVPAFSGLYAPHWKASARGVVAGLTRFVGKGHIARAALEATAFQTAEVLEAMRKDSGIKLASLRVDGGMTVNELLMQFQADILGTTVVRPKCIETTALGAAYAAGLAVGFWKDLDDLKANWAIDKKWRSKMTAADRRARMKSWKKAVKRSLDWED